MQDKKENNAVPASQGTKEEAQSPEAAELGSTYQKAKSRMLDARRRSNASSNNSGSQGRASYPAAAEPRPYEPKGKARYSVKSAGSGAFARRNSNNSSTAK